MSSKLPDAVKEMPLFCPDRRYFEIHDDYPNDFPYFIIQISLKCLCFCSRGWSPCLLTLCRCPFVSQIIQFLSTVKRVKAERIVDKGGFRAVFRFNNCADSLNGDKLIYEGISICNCILFVAVYFITLSCLRGMLEPVERECRMDI